MQTQIRLFLRNNLIKMYTVYCSTIMFQMYNKVVKWICAKFLVKYQDLFSLKKKKIKIAICCSCDWHFKDKAVSTTGPRSIFSFFLHKNIPCRNSLEVPCEVCYLFVLILRFIMKTSLYNFDPLKPHFYIVKLGFIGVYIIFLIFAQKILIVGTC